MFNFQLYSMACKHLWLMRRSIQNFNIPPPPPPGIPREFDCASCPERGEFERWVGRVGNLNQINLFFWRNTPMRFFRFLQGLTDLQDRCSFLLVNNSFKRVFKRRLKVSLWHISLWKACEVFDWRQNLSLRRGSSVLIGGAFEWLFCPEGREFEQANLQKFKCPGGCPGGGDVELSSWSAHKFHTDSLQNTTGIFISLPTTLLCLRPVRVSPKKKWSKHWHDFTTSPLPCTCSFWLVLNTFWHVLATFLWLSWQLLN